MKDGLLLKDVVAEVVRAHEYSSVQYQLFFREAPPVKNPIESMYHFCIIQLELLKARELKLRNEIQDCHIQREFLSQLLGDLGDIDQYEGDIIGNLLDTMKNSRNRSKKK